MSTKDNNAPDTGDTSNVDETPNFLEMSDEDIANYAPSKLEALSSNTTEIEDVEGTPKEDTEEGDGVDTSESEDVEDSKDTSESTEDEKDSDESIKTEPAEGVEGAKAEGEAVTPEAPIDYKAMYEKITAPFKANGRDVKVNTPEDAITLMQMGANYNKKMSAMKPGLALLKMLEANGLMDETKLSYLIDLDKKNPEAINKLVKESGIDPMDLSAEIADSYKPKSHVVDERTLRLEEVLGDLDQSPHYNRTLEVVSDKWDRASKAIVADNPEILVVINDHIANGYYDQISEEVANERTFGRLKGLSDIEAYKQVGDAIQARGGFAAANTKQTTPSAPPVVIAPTTAKANVDNSVLKDKKRAASSTKSTTTAPANLEFNPLEMSDEEFKKMAKPMFA